ncbi:hypothetical protein D3C79_814450 [compost metagenome]
MLAGEGTHLRAVRVVPGVRPLSPVLAQAARLRFAEQGFEAAVLLQWVAGLSAVAVEVGPQRVVAVDEVFIQHVQQLVACGPCLGPID